MDFLVPYLICIRSMLMTMCVCWKLGNTEKDFNIIIHLMTFYCGFITLQFLHYHCLLHLHHHSPHNLPRLHHLIHFQQHASFFEHDF